jgi:hypothetical protein
LDAAVLQNFITAAIKESYSYLFHGEENEHANDQRQQGNRQFMEKYISYFVQCISVVLP